MGAVRIARYIYGKGCTSNLQINKLLYICFGFYGARHGGHLFCDEIQAWPYGPVVPSVYRAHRDGILGQGSAPVPGTEEKAVIDDVLDIYGRKAPFLLVRLTHQAGTPWSNAYAEGQKGVEIGKDDIIRYYTGFLEKTDRWVASMSTDSFWSTMQNLART